MVIADIIIISLTLISCFIGLSRGFIKELLSTSKWLLASYVAFITFEKTKMILSKFLKDSAILDLLAGGLIFAIVFFFLSVIFNYLSKIINTSDLGFIDKLLGSCFGFTRIMVILALTLIIYNNIFFNEKKPDWMIGSYSIEYIEKATKCIQNNFLNINLKNDIIT